MRSVAALLAVPLALLLVPIASAQVPPPPADPIGTVCDLVTGAAPVDVPLCPEDPPAPQNPDPQAHQHDAPAPPPASPQDAPTLAADVAGQAQAAVDDPPSAPERVVSILLTIVQFVKDLLHLPVAASQSVGLHSLDALGKVGHAAHEATAGVNAATHKVADAAHAAVARVTSFFHKDAPASAPRWVAPTVGKDAAAKTKGLLGKLPVDVSSVSP